MDIANWLVLELILLPFAYWLWVMLYSMWLAVQPLHMGSYRSFLHRGKERGAWYVSRWAWFGVTYAGLSLVLYGLIV